MEMSSNRVKRLLRRIENIRGDKKRKVVRSDDENSRDVPSNVWKLKSSSDFPTNNIYNTSSRSPPAELFRKDLISAMKLPDSDPLFLDDYWLISDQWKQDWERGVQVPVNPDALPEPVIRVIRKKDKAADFKLPKKLLRIAHDDDFNSEEHQISSSVGLVNKVCRYDLDDCDLHWLETANAQRRKFNLSVIDADAMESIMELFETQCYENMQDAIHSEAVLGIEYDENVICDVCRSPDSEEGNEMVFCDSCDICVHQACYGITSIPEGSWLCRTCSLAIKPSCILCPNKGGAMKATRTGQKWAHVSCALWIPEVSIGCVEKMEPITKIAHIPPSRWALICCLCRERAGACIQCSVKSCKTAYHVTCGFQNGLEMKAVVEDENDEDGVKLRSYCPKHSKNKDLASSDSEGEEDSCSSSRQNTTKDKASARARKLQQIETLFFKYVHISETAKAVKTTIDIVEFVYHYWKQKRRANFNAPLLIPSSAKSDALGNSHEDGLFARMKMFVHLRQDLERVRNLCYMVSRREKLSRSWTRMREEVFHQQVSVLTDASIQLTDDERKSVIHACHGRNIYDRLYAHNQSCCQSGVNALDKFTSEPAKLSTDASGLVKTPRRKVQLIEKVENPYAKTYYFNGLHARTRRKSGDLPGASDKGCDSRGRHVVSKPLSGSAVDNVHHLRVSEGLNKQTDKRGGVTRQDSVPAVPRNTNILKGSHQQDDDSIGFEPNLEVSFAQGSPGKSKENVVEDSVTEYLQCDEIRSLTETTSDNVRCNHVDVSSSVTSVETCSGAKEEIQKEDSKCTSVKENVESVVCDYGFSPGTNSERRRRRKQSEDGSSDAVGTDEHLVKRKRKTKQRFRNLRSPPKESSSSKSASSSSPTTSDPPVKDKHRQETEKIHESLFLGGRKGSLAGYRIPKVCRSESESTTKQEDVSEPHTPLSPLPQTDSKPSFTTTVTSAQSQHHNHASSWKEQGASVNSNNSSSSNNSNSTFISQPSKWNGNLRPMPMPLLPTPPIPRLPLMHSERRVTRQDKTAYTSSGPSSSSSSQSPSLHSNEQSECGSGRIVIKLRKDPNFPESQCWRRDCDEVDSAIYDFRCEASESPPSRHIRLQLDTRYDRHLAVREPLMHPADPRSYKRNKVKYSMRSRRSLVSAGSFNSNLS